MRALAFDPDPAVYSDADPDPVSQNFAGPDPDPLKLVRCTNFKEYGDAEEEGIAKYEASMLPQSSI
jgi:hypothetical protein